MITKYFSFLDMYDSMSHSLLFSNIIDLILVTLCVNPGGTIICISPMREFGKVVVVVCGQSCNHVLEATLH